MKKIKKIGGLVTIFLLNFYNTCFADVVIGNGPAPEGHGLHRIPPASEPEPINYVLIGILVLVIAICAVLIIRRIIKKKKEKENDNK